MSILNGINKSTEQKVYEDILLTTKNLVAGEKNRCLSMYNKLWGSQESPKEMSECQAILDLFGNDAYQIFDFHGKWQTFIASIDSTYVPILPPYDYTINEDGTVTLSEKE
jgi:hypothetical protein